MARGKKKSGGNVDGVQAHLSISPRVARARTHLEGRLAQCQAAITAAPLDPPLGADGGDGVVLPGAGAGTGTGASALLADNVTVHAAIGVHQSTRHHMIPSCIG